MEEKSKTEFERERIFMVLETSEVNIWRWKFQVRQLLQLKS